MSPDCRGRRYKNAEIIINSNIRIPLNDHQKIERTYSTGVKTTNHSRNTFFIKNQEVKAQMFNEKSYFLINISAQKQIIDREYVDNFISALSFLTGRIVNWNIIKMFNDVEIYKYFYNPNDHQKIGSTLSKPPFDFVAFFQETKYPERLFFQFFNFINKDSKRNLYKITNRNLLSSYSYLHVFGLSLSANIEELLKVYFSAHVKDIVLQPQEILYAIDKIKEIKLKESLENRIIGLLKNINNQNIHVKDILKMLQNKRILDNECIRDWNKLRNASAHGDLTDNFETQKHLDLVYKNLVLYYKIIFLIIGYKGKYSNYCVHGHPSASFDSEV